MINADLESDYERLDLMYSQKETQICKARLREDGQNFAIKTIVKKYLSTDRM